MSTELTTTPHYVLSRLARVIQARRESLRMTQEQLSERCGLHRTYISDIERGARNLSLKNLSRLAVALELPPSALVRYSETSGQPVQQFETSEYELRDMYENAPCGYHSLDKHGKIVRINATHANWLGYTKEELLGKCITEVLTPQSIRIFAEKFPFLKQFGYLKECELEMVRKDGRYVPITVSANAVKDGSGNYLLSRCVVISKATYTN